MDGNDSRYVVNDLIADGKEVGAEEFKQLFFELLGRIEQEINSLRAEIPDLKKMQERLIDLAHLMIEVSAFYEHAQRMLSREDFLATVNRLSRIILSVGVAKTQTEEAIRPINNAFFSIELRLDGMR